MTKLVLWSIGLFSFVGIITSGLTTKEADKTTNISHLQSSREIYFPLDSAGNKFPDYNFTVVELFTSQGCSSCPPADDILRGLAERKNVMALSFHVTYWNRLGWKDPFSKPEFDERQSNYGAHFNLNSIYTPQVVINGVAEMVGSHGSQIENTLAKTSGETFDLKIELSKNLKDKTLIINYKINTNVGNKLLHIALVERNLETKVQRGENGGRILKHDNVVRLFKTVKITSSALHPETPNPKSEIDDKSVKGVENFNLQDDFKLKDCSIIAYLQDTQTMKIVAASKMGL
jgi:hypothetical protein